MKAVVIMLAVFAAVTNSFAQKGAVMLKWKLQPGETIVYKTVMNEVDSANSKFKMNLDMGGLEKLLEGLPADSAESSEKKDEVTDMLRSMRESMSKKALYSSLKKNDKGGIDMWMEMKESEEAKKPGTDSLKRKEADLLAMMSQLSGGVLLRGSISKEGKITSFYVNNKQKNLIAMMFELPGKPVRKGDSWPLDVNFISMDQNFICDSAARKNVVTLTDIKKQGNETIAVINYDMLEYVSGTFNNPFGGAQPTMMKWTFTCTGEFSIEKGRWINYSGLSSLHSTGFMESTQVQEYKLVPVAE